MSPLRAQRRSIALTLGLLGSIALTACSSDSSPATETSSSSSAPVTSSSSSSASTTSSGAPVTSSSSAPSTSSAPPLSPFEKDPAVQALRAWAAQAGRTVNSGKYVDDDLRALMTKDLATTMKNVLGTEVGNRYPGPLPFTPTRVVVVDSNLRDVRMCVVGTGFSLNPKTGKPAEKYQAVPIDAAAARVNGTWLVSQLDTATFSCKGVKIKEVHW